MTMHSPRDLRRLASLLALVIVTGCSSLGGKCEDAACAQDAQLTTQVKAAVYADAALRAPNLVYVRVRNGVVYLSGTVSTDLQKDQAESYARGVSGVDDVVNNIGVQNAGR
jgi:osmotically-inducible protein OsmY